MREAAQGLRLAPVRGARAPVVGPHRSAYRGRGIDFDEVRAYQPGDDVRTIDAMYSACNALGASPAFAKGQPLQRLLA